MRRYAVNAAELRSRSREHAKNLRETFTDRPAERAHAVHWTWPKSMREVGIVHAVMYTSDKWKSRGSFEDYKHRSEGPQCLLVRPGFIVDYDTRRRLEIPWRSCDLNGPMPEAIAELAPILGIQAEFYEREGAELVPSGEHFQIEIAQAKLGAARHPETGETFLIVYTPSDLHAVIVGEKLDVTKDGVVG